jgi:hypothetical protein
MQSPSRLETLVVGVMMSVAGVAGMLMFVLR